MYNEIPAFDLDPRVLLAKLFTSHDLPHPGACQSKQEAYESDKKKESSLLKSDAIVKKFEDSHRNRRYARRQAENIGR